MDFERILGVTFFISSFHSIMLWRSYKIYSSGNRGVKKSPGPRGSRDEEFLVPSLFGSIVEDETKFKIPSKITLNT